MLTKRWFAKNYGWDPEQVSRLDLEDLTWLPLIEDAVGVAQDRLQKQEARHPRPQSRH
jgi:hypothetical protein